MSLPHSVRSSHLGQEVLLPTFVFEKSFRYHYVTSFLSPNILLKYTTIPNFFHHLQLLKNISTNKLCISLLITPTFSILYHTKPDSSMTSSIKSKTCIDAFTYPNMTMEFSIEAMGYTGTLVNTTLTMITSIEPRGCTDLLVYCGPFPPLSPFSHTSLPFHFHCVTSFDFTFHPLLYSYHSVWISFILPILQVLVTSFHLKCIFLFSHHNSNISCPFKHLIFLIQTTIPS